jgi:predicted DNA-binding protein
MRDNKKMISLEISDELREALRVEAFHKAITVSALIRQILEDQLQVKADNKPTETK